MIPDYNSGSWSFFVEKAPLAPIKTFHIGFRLFTKPICSVLLRVRLEKQRAGVGGDAKNPNRKDK